jgi:hypothetical protein
VLNEIILWDLNSKKEKKKKENNRELVDGTRLESKWGVSDKN